MADTDVPMSDTNGQTWPGLGEEWRPWCCPEPRCTPVHTLAGSERPLSEAEPGESFFCFGAAPTVEFIYDGVKHVNDTRSCTYTALKGVISYQENADDWRAIAAAYSRAVTSLLRHRGGDQGVRNDDVRAASQADRQPRDSVAQAKGGLSAVAASETKPPDSVTHHDTETP